MWIVELFDLGHSLRGSVGVDDFGVGKVLFNEFGALSHWLWVGIDSSDLLPVELLLISVTGLLGREDGVVDRVKDLAYD